jgi:hypothetical protein
MDWVKTSRLVESIDHEDSWIDKAGYTALGTEFVHETKSLGKTNGKATNEHVRTKK